MMRVIAPALFGLLLSGCTTVPEPRDDGWAAIGEATYVGPLTVTPVELVEDSRCPADVQCIQAGRVVVRALVEARESRFMNIVAGEDHRIAAGMFTIDRVEPAARSDVDITPDDYRFRFRYRPDIMDVR